MSEPFLASALSRIGSLWTRFHKHHFIWDIIVAVLLAAYFAYYYAGFDRQPYKLYVLIGDDIPNTANTPDDPRKRERLLRPAQGLTVNGTAVTVVPVDISAKSPESATIWANNIKQDNALLVVGILDSEPTEQSLLTYFQARPQIPFIATVQSDNNLVQNCPESGCSDDGKPIPLLQLSPTNDEQAKWAVKFATEQNMHKFLVVSDDNSPNKVYVRGLSQAYHNELAGIGLPHPGTPLDSATAALNTGRKLDCVFYAGDSGDAGLLLEKVGALKTQHPAVILSDTAVPRNIQDSKELFRHSIKAQVNLTDQNDATYFKQGTNAYGLDGVAIAAQLLEELDERGFDWRFWLKWYLLNRSNAEDVRRNLVRIMQEDAKFHTSYFGAEETSQLPGLKTVYTFTCLIKPDGSVGKQRDGSVGYCKRYGGIFHVWEWDPKLATMKDVDKWHPRDMHAQ